VHFCKKSLRKIYKRNGGGLEWITFGGKNVNCIVIKFILTWLWKSDDIYLSLSFWNMYFYDNCNNGFGGSQYICNLK
jgi:hypothetical protein